MNAGWRMFLQSLKEASGYEFFFSSFSFSKDDVLQPLNYSRHIAGNSGNTSDSVVTIDGCMQAGHCRVGAMAARSRMLSLGVQTSYY